MVDVESPLGSATVYPEEGSPIMASLARPSNDRVIAGVCSAIARRFGLSSNVVRLIFVISLFLPGPQFLIYLAGWLLIPDERKASVY